MCTCVDIFANFVSIWDNPNMHTTYMPTFSKIHQKLFFIDKRKKWDQFVPGSIGLVSIHLGINWVSPIYIYIYIYIHIYMGETQLIPWRYNPSPIDSRTNWSHFFLLSIKKKFLIDFAKSWHDNCMHMRLHICQLLAKFTRIILFID